MLYVLTVGTTRFQFNRLGDATAAMSALANGTQLKYEYPKKANGETDWTTPPITVADLPDLTIRAVPDDDYVGDVDDNVPF